MCGIAGILRMYDPSESPPAMGESIPERWLDVLDASIVHRGPDGQGRLRDRVTRADGVVVDVALVHRRLSILDHAGGGQPMVQGGPAWRFGPTGPDTPTPDGTGAYDRVETHDCPRCRERADQIPAHTPLPAPDRATVAVAFNGCIYNHQSLRRELEALGHVFESDHADTEVILHAWREWGEHGLYAERGAGVAERLDGMFACIVWDAAFGLMVTMRDRAGEKPIYDASKMFGRDIVGACSSPAGLLRLTHAESVPGIDGTHLKDWIRLGWAARPPVHTLDELLPRHVRLFERTDRAGYGERVYWMSPDEGVTDPLTEDDADRLIRESVRSRLDADVPLGCFLSGGIDSALIARHAADALAEQGMTLKTFTVRMPDARFDESEAAAETAAHIGTAHTTLDCDPVAAESLVALIHQLGLPFGDSSLLPASWVCRTASAHVSVALSGEGGDELFLGYERSVASNLAAKLPAPISLISPRLLNRRDPRSRSDKLARLLVADRYAGYLDLLSIFDSADLRRLIPGVRPRRGDATRWEGLASPTDRDNLRLADGQYLAFDLLRKADTASMAVGLEVRCPMLDRVLMQRASETPREVLLPGGRRKGLLKSIARQYFPDRIVDRPKMGFTIPIGEWFRTDHGGMRRLLRDHLESRDPFPDLPVEIDASRVRRMLAEHDAAGETSINPWRGRDHAQRLYMLLVLSIWARWLRGLRTEAVIG